MIRKAIIIGNNTGHQAPVHLSGVTKDLDNYQKYLKSSVGGEWLPSEITILHNRNRADILLAIANCIADYSFVVFSGHGFMSSKDRNTYICVSDGFVSENELNTNLHRQTLILDCCREITDVSESRAFTGEIGSFAKGGQINLSGFKRTIINSRQKFDNAVSQSSLGQCRAYACSVDQTSGDNPASGGVFSSALMRAGINFGSTDNTIGVWLPIKQAVETAAANINNDPFTNQNASFITIPSNMNLTHPFAITNLKQRQVW